MRFNLVFLIACTGASQLLYAASFVLLAQLVGPGPLGEVAVPLALGMLLASLIDLGSNALSVREIASGRETTGVALGRLLARSLLLVPLLAVGSACLYLAGNDYYYAVVVALGTALGQGVQSIRRATFRLKSSAMLTLAERTILFASVALFNYLDVLSPQSFCLAAIASGLSVQLSAVWAEISRRKGTLRLHLERPYASIGGFGITAILNAIQGNDVALLGLLSGPTATGEYAAISRWIQPMNMVATVHGAAVAPSVARAGDVKAATRELLSTWWLPVVSMTAAVAVAIGSTPIVRMVLGPAFEASAPSLRWLAVASAFVSCTQPVYVLLQNRGFDKVVSLGFCISVAAQGCMLVYLGPRVGAVGAAYAALGGQVVLFVFLASTLAKVWGRESA